MGGRGAASGISDKGKKYGIEYTTLFQDGNIKFIAINSGSITPPMETMTKGRVYVTVDMKKNEPKHISYYDKENKRIKQIDLYPAHKNIMPHVHHGYEHNENDSKKGASRLTPEEKKIVERVKEKWYSYLNNRQ